MSTPHMSESEYNFTDAQRARWNNSLSPQLNRGDRARIAEQLHKAKVAELRSCRNMVSGFFKGEEKELRRIFEHNKRLKIIAAHLEMVPDDLWHALRLAKRGHEPDSSDRSHWVPGFEDLEPFDITESFFSPPCGERRTFTNGLNSSVSSSGPSVASKLLDFVTTDDQSAPNVLFLVGGEPETSRTCLRWLEYKLTDDGILVSDWRSPAPPTGAVVTIPNYDSLVRSEKSQLLRAVTRHSLVVVATVGASKRGVEMYPSRIELQFSSGTVHWAISYIDHLSKLFASHSSGSRLASIKSWLEDDPRSSLFAEKIETLGLLARHVYDGGSLPYANLTFIQNTLGRAAQQLKHRGFGGESIFVEACGLRWLGLAAWRACSESNEWISLNDMATIISRASEGVIGPDTWEAVGHLGIFTTLDALIDVGFFEKRGDTVRCSSPHLLVSALGHHISEHLTSTDVLQKVVLDSKWHPALQSAVEFIEDPSPVIQALGDLPPSCRHALAMAMIWVLAAKPAPSDLEGYNYSFLWLLRWWAQQVPEQNRIVLTIGPAQTSSASKPETRLGGRPPLLTLAQISREKRGILQQRWTAQTLIDLEVDRVTTLIEEFDSTQGLLEQNAELALMIGAPFQSDQILSAALWETAPGVGKAHSVLGLDTHDFALWFRTVGFHRVSDSSQGNVSLGHIPVRSYMNQNAHGTELWSAALGDLISSNRELGLQRLAEAISCYAAHGKLWNRKALQRIWESLSEQDRTWTRPSVVNSLPPVEKWQIAPEGKTWLMHSFFDEEQLDSSWKRRNTADQVDCLYWPWRSFLEAGLPSDTILDWAMKTFDTQPKTALREFEGGSALQHFNVELTPQQEALSHFLNHGQPTDLAAIVARGPLSYARIALSRFVEPSVPEREALLRACTDHRVEEERLAFILAGMTPRPEEFEIWSSFSPRFTSRLGQIAHACRLDLARPGTWAGVTLALNLLEDIAQRPRSHMDLVQNPKPGMTDQDLSSCLSRFSRDFIGQLGLIVSRGHTPRDRVLIAIFERVLVTPSLRKNLLGGSRHAVWWNLAQRELGNDFVLGCIRDGHSDGSQFTSARISTLTLSETTTWAESSCPLVGEHVVRGFRARAAAESLQLPVALGTLSEPTVDLTTVPLQRLVAFYIDKLGEDAVTSMGEALIHRTRPELELFWRGVAQAAETTRALGLALEELIRLESCSG